jgi:hypothetical protein
MKPNTERIRALNDELRRNLPNGHAVLGWKYTSCPILNLCSLMPKSSL